MSATIPSTALLLPPSPSASSIAFWTPTIASAYARLRGLYIGVSPPLPGALPSPRHKSSSPLIYDLAAARNAEDVDIRIVFLADAAFGPVVSVEQLASGLARVGSGCTMFDPPSAGEEDDAVTLQEVGDGCCWWGFFHLFTAE
ncbi:hypothetical protein FN846DRAFT_912236 [Sphaerosporella brunnea]|uniref:Uncharacterized protein n=1 Tax=Sphaerosporella brunnea TaxID=1250544 RepID=A0A5J5EHX7_9PEZI|nr:hypothetical protein FN846DRAFT_912236 [Sphaerosporella brunnea]